MSETESCKKIFEDFMRLLDNAEYGRVAESLKEMQDDSKTMSEIKSALVITKAFKYNEIIQQPRASLAEYYEKRFSIKLI